MRNYDEQMGGYTMYEKLYFFLFNRITDALIALKDGRSLDAIRILSSAQSEAEE
jgi:hypothetical protein